jgi:hypothetical protein
MGAKRKTQAATARMLKSKVFRMRIRFLLVLKQKSGVKQAWKGFFRFSREEKGVREVEDSRTGKEAFSETDRS